MSDGRKHPCCSCCDGGVDPELHAENGRDFHDVECTSCDRADAIEALLAEARRAAFTAGFYSARRHPGIAAATHSPDYPRSEPTDRSDE